MLSLLYFSVILNFIRFTKVTGDENYFWKEYTGDIPSNAWVGGHTAFGSPVYIAQTYQHQKGLFVGSIYPMVKEVEFSGYGGVITTTFDIKILCSDTPQRLVWKKTHHKTFEHDIEPVKTVSGGYDAVNGTLLVGRVFYQGNDIIGEVYTTTGNAHIWFAHNKIHRPAYHYEVLTIDLSKKIMQLDVRFLPDN